MKKLLFLILILFISCKPKNVYGLYRSNFAESGFFVTDLKLKNDSSFYYYLRGDLVSEERIGRYQVNKNILYLQFDTIKNKNGDSIDYAYPRKFDIKISKNGFPFHQKYKISGSSLFAYNMKTNEIRKKTKGYFHLKKYFLFGPKYYEKRPFLKKIDTSK